MILGQDDLENVLNRILDKSPLLGLNALQNTTLSLWIGSGLAKIPAAYGAGLIQQYTGKSSQLISALDYCNKPFLKDFPILISLKGENEDAVGVAKSIANRSIKETVLITGDTEGRAALALRSVRHSIISASFPPRDHRCVNINSVFMLSTLVYRLINQTFPKEHNNWITHDSIYTAFKKASTDSYVISNYIASIDDWSKKQLIILGQGFSSELTLTWQAILSESGITNPIILDIKDYTHGDHLATIKNESVFFLIIKTPNIEKVVDVFISRFSKKFNIVTIPLIMSGPTAFWENLFYSFNVTSLLSSLLGYGGKRPPRDPLVHSWRGWGEI